MIELALHVGVEPTLVAFAAAPEHVVFAAQLFGDLQHFLHLTGSVSKDIGVAAGRRAVHETRVAEEIGCAPQQLDAVRSCSSLSTDTTASRLSWLSCSVAPSGDVPIVETIEGRTEFFHELDEHASTVLRIGHIIIGRLKAALPCRGRRVCPCHAWCANRRCRSASGPSWTCPRLPRRRCNA